MRLIDADALITATKEWACGNCERRKGTTKNGKVKFVYEIGDIPCRACGIGDMLDEIEGAPTVDAVHVKHGYWVNLAEHNMIDAYKCSACKEIWIGIGGYNYCPNCGARMDGEE